MFCVGALGELALGEKPRRVTGLNTLCKAMATGRPAAGFASALSTRAEAMAQMRAPGGAVVRSRVVAMAEARSPGGVVTPGRAEAMAQSRAPGGFNMPGRAETIAQSRAQGGVSLPSRARASATMRVQGGVALSVQAKVNGHMQAPGGAIMRNGYGCYPVGMGALGELGLGELRFNCASAHGIVQFVTGSGAMHIIKITDTPRLPLYSYNVNIYWPGAS